MHGVSCFFSGVRANTEIEKHDQVEQQEI